MITLGLDPSLRGFGWCVHRSDVAGPNRIVARGHHSTSTKQVFVQRYMTLRSLVMRLLEDHPEVEVVGVESPPFGEMWSEGLYGLFLYVCEALYTHRKDVVFFDPVTLKLLAKLDPSIRRGVMDKRAMVEAARADCALKGSFNHNEADAYHLARFAARFWSFRNGDLTEEELTPSETHVFCRTHTYQRGKKAGRTIKSGLLFREDDRFFRFSTLPEA